MGLRLPSPAQHDPDDSADAYDRYKRRLSDAWRTPVDDADNNRVPTLLICPTISPPFPWRSSRPTARPTISTGRRIRRRF
jgi:hypothetical protein